MVAYIIQLAEEIRRESAAAGNRVRVPSLLRILCEELDRLDPRDFLPSAQYEFLMARMWAHNATPSEGALEEGTIIYLFDFENSRNLSDKIISVLEHFGGEGSQVVIRQFSFLKDPDLRQIVERDYRELRLKVFPSQAWKSTVVLAGSITEAIFFDQLTGDPAVTAKAIASSKAPKNKAGTVLNLAKAEWNLESLINVAADIGIIPLARADSFDQVLRDYRNFVHPKKELRSSHPCTEAEAMMSVGALEGVCNILT